MLRSISSRTTTRGLLASLILAALAASCAGGPEPVPAPAPPAPEKVRKERIVVLKVPVMLKETAFYPDGLVDEYAVYAWDAARELLLEKRVYDATRPDPVERVAYEYAAGKLAAENELDAEGRLKSRREYGRDAGGNIVSERLLDGSSRLQSSSTYAWDASGRKTEWKAFDAKGSLKAQTGYVYGAKGLESISIRDGAGAPAGSVKVERGADGSEKRSYLAADGSLQRIEISLFEKGFLRRFESRRADSSLAQAIDYVLGPLGETLSATVFDGQGAVKERKTWEWAVREVPTVEVYYE